MPRLLAPSILSADFSALGSAISMINTSDADWFHVDVMDGVFVPNISFGFPVMEALQKHAKKPLDVHLMIVNPERYIDRFAEMGAYCITVHYEACTHLHRTIQQIKALGVKAGVAINPHTPASFLAPILADLDLILVMTVNPGFGGQDFIENGYEKIEYLNKKREAFNYDYLIEVDGGVNLKNAQLLYASGADVLVAGNAVFNQEIPELAIQMLKNK